MKKFLVTGGAGFVGSNICIALKERYDCEVIALDNLLRRGSEYNLKKIINKGIKFVHGDVRNYIDIDIVGEVDFLFECSAEPSVMAGIDGNPKYVLDTNLNGALNCAEFCRKYNAGLFFLSTSRVYPIPVLTSCKIEEIGSRFILSEYNQPEGISKNGMSEKILMKGCKSFYGSSKYAAEQILEEYRQLKAFPIIINRCGVLAGPGQFGKIDQGIITFWLATHYFNKNLSYIGFNGSGKQVRDVLHIDDLIELLIIQMDNYEKYSEDIYNVGGGDNISVSLQELTGKCSYLTGRNVVITKKKETRYGDIPVYVSDIKKITQLSNWKPVKSLDVILRDIYDWFSTDLEAQKILEMNIL